MTLFLGPEDCERFIGIMVAAFLVLLFFPSVCIASTPPVQPSLRFDILNQSSVQETPLTLFSHLEPVWYLRHPTGTNYSQFVFCSGWIPVWIFFHPENCTCLPISRYLRIPHIDRKRGFSAGHIHVYCRGPALWSNQPSDYFHSPSPGSEEWISQKIWTRTGVCADFCNDCHISYACPCGHGKTVNPKHGSYSWCPDEARLILLVLG
jgi:hypothetical protein